MIHPIVVIQQRIIMGSKTRIWHVRLELETDIGMVVIVTDDDPRTPGVVRFRTITPTAAARQYIRHNLARRLAEGWDRETVEMYRGRTPTIRVVKSE